MEKQKILVVDDDKHIAELISLYMMKEGLWMRRLPILINILMMRIYPD